MLVVDVRLVFMAELLNGGKHRVGRGLAQAAQGRGLDVLRQVFQPLDIAVLALAFANAVEDFQHAARADAAGGALAAAFIHGEIQEEAGDVHHTVVLVHDDHAAGAHHGAGRDQVVIVHGGVEHVRGQAAARGAAGLHGLERLAAGNAAADFVNDLAQRGAHRHFHKAGVVDFAAQGEHLRALGALGAHGGEPFGAV